MLREHAMAPVRNTSHDLHAAVAVRRAGVVVLIIFPFREVEALLEVFAHLMPSLAVRMTCVEVKCL